MVYGHAQKSDEDRRPRLSIGLPVFNHENYLKEAITSVLAQDFADVELIVRDNASTDGNAAICRAYAARGELFKWMAHDDLIAPDILRRSVARLDAEPGGVLFCIDVCEIDADDLPIREFSSAFADVEGADTASRFAAAIRTNHACTDFFGLFRRDALCGTQLHGTYRGSDRALLAEVVLRGPIVHVPARLLLNREHEERYSRTVMRDRKGARRWLGESPHEAGRFHEWVLYRRYLALVDRYVSEPKQRRACHRHLVAWLFQNRNGWHLMKDVLWGTVPVLMRPLGRFKRTLRPPRRRAARRRVPDLAPR